MEKTTCWFKNWFDSNYYHLLYKNRNLNEASLFVDTLLGYLKPGSQATMWDLCCGKGRHAIHLNNRGYKVIGTDLSLESIKYASGFENDKLSFFQHDMRSPFYANYFHFVFNLFTSFGYFDNNKDDEKVFQSVFSALKTDGLFVLDYLNTDKALKQLIAEEKKEIDGVVFNIKKRIESGFILKEIDVIDKEMHYSFYEKVKILRLTDFKKLGEKSGFQLQHVFGDYSLTTFAAENSERLILVFKKN